MFKHITYINIVYVMQFMGLTYVPFLYSFVLYASLVTKLHSLFCSPSSPLPVINELSLLYCDGYVNIRSVVCNLCSFDRDRT